MKESSERVDGRVMEIDTERWRSGLIKRGRWEGEGSKEIHIKKLAHAVAGQGGRVSDYLIIFMFQSW